MNENYVRENLNYFIMSSNYGLTLEEQKLILALANMVQPNDEDFKSYKFKINDFMKLLGVSSKTKYTEVPKIANTIVKKVFQIKENDTITKIAWLSSATYKKGSGMVELEFSPRLKPYILKLNNLFTQYKLANILSMKSKYSPRIYELLKCNELKCNELKKQKFIEVEVDDLKKLLRIEELYPRYADFKKKVILQAQKELHKLSDISFDFEEIKTGRKVTSLKFFINSHIHNEENKYLDKLTPTTDKKEMELYEQRKFAILDRVSDLENAEEKGKQKSKLEIAKNLLDILDIETIAIKTGLSIDDVKNLKK